MTKFQPEYDLQSDSAVGSALAPPQPGLAVRSLGLVFPGVRRSGRQIRDYADGWRVDAARALGGTAPVFVVFGDSLGQGIGAGNRGAGYASLVAAELGRTHRTPVAVLNLSRSGARINDVLQTQIPAFAEVMAKNPPTIIGGVCTVGSNDLVRSGLFGRARRLMDELVVALPDGVVVATVPDVGSLVAKKLNRHIRERAEIEGRPVADVAATLTSWRGFVAADRFHPNDDGHALWAEVIGAALRPVTNSGPQAAPAIRPS